eukprot:gb/GECG01012083.1/.p1 GENE.gb/GECG01012083.1/~~gb/GECG01012083.1/.p1  ORF type:complete len:570 (+),score=51.02 gb/GECG01012083.1/:1-1710(+)
MSNQFLKQHLALFLPPHAQLSGTLLSKVKKEAFSMKLGNPEANVKLVPPLAELLRGRGHHCRYETINKDEMNSIARRKERQRRQKLERQLGRALSSEETVHHDIRENEEDVLNLHEDAKFVSFLGFSPKTTNIDNMAPVFFSDAAHMLNDSGFLYSLWGISANKEAILVGAAFQLYNESQSSWEKFFSFVKEKFPEIDHCNTTFIMDADKGEISAFTNVNEEAFPFLCSKHRKDNFVKRFGRSGYKLQKLYEHTVTACNTEDYSVAIGKLEGDAPANQVNHIMQVSPHLQFLFQAHRREGSSRVNTMGYHSSSVVESMNEAMVPVRRCTFFEGLITLVHGEATRFRKRQNAISKAVEEGKTLTPAGEEIVQSLEQTRRRYAATTRIWGSNTNQPSVQLHGDTCHREVNLATLNCSCGAPEVKAQPCPHIYVAARAVGIPNNSIFAHNHFSVDLWKLQFPENIQYDNVHIGEVADNRHLANQLLQIPPVAPNPPGRPPNNQRLEGIHEQARRKTVRCSQCKRRGHNRRSPMCPMNQPCASLTPALVTSANSGSTRTAGTSAPTSNHPSSA